MRIYYYRRIEVIWKCVYEFNIVIVVLELLLVFDIMNFNVMFK